jgi:hypothetical protein
MAMGDGCSEPFALGRASVAARHVGGGPGLIDEDKLLRIEIELAFEPGLAALQDVGTLLLCSSCYLI